MALLMQSLALPMNYIGPSSSVTRSCNSGNKPIETFIPVGTVLLRVSLVQTPLDQVKHKMAFGCQWPFSFAEKGQKPRISPQSLLTL